MKRSEQLAPLSRDHHVALEVALRLRRADPSTVADAVAGFGTYWQEHGAAHFEQEERAVLPLLPDDDAALQAAAARVRDEHRELHELARTALADPTDVQEAAALGELLHAHVRFEERELFPLIEDRLDPDALDRVGAALHDLRG